MSTITQISLWKDTGFTEGCLEVPKKGSSLPTPDFTYTGNYVPSTTDIFSKLKLRVPYTTLMDCSYIAITLDMNNGTDKVFYGWIDNVSIISDTTSSALTQVDWHVDLWRTYISSAIIGSGMVMRRPLLGELTGDYTGDAVPPQNYPYRFKTVASSYPICGGSINGYIYVLYTMTNVSISTTTYSSVSCYPIYLDEPDRAAGTSEFTCPTFNSFIKGSWDEEIGLAPSSIKGAYYSPIPPTNQLEGWTLSKIPNESGDPAEKAGYTPVSVTTAFTERVVELPEVVMTDDVTTYVITGFDGEIVGVLPWGIPIKTLRYRTILDSNGGYIQIRTGIDSHAEGTCFTIPLIALEITQNGWSEYAYSGARQADINQKVAEANQALESGLAGVGTSAITGAVSGAQMAALGGPLGMLAGGLMGAISSSATQAMNTAASYGITTRYNDIFQDITDYRMARQSNGLIMTGTGFDSVRFGNRQIMLVKMTTDEYSQTQRGNDITLYGAHVSEPRESCQSLVDAGGPLQISNVVVRGSIPVQAKEYIRGRLSNGVRMI